jgi:phage terminase small subunit
MTPKQQRFVEEYLVDLNATQAAIRAGFSKATAEQQGHQLLKKTSVAEAIKKTMDDRAKRTGITADRVLEELGKIAFYNPGRVFGVDKDGLPYIDFSEATEDDWRVVAEVTNETTRKAIPEGDGYETTTKVKVKHQCKLQALNSIARHLGMFNDKIDVTSGGQPFKALIGIDIDKI